MTDYFPYICECGNQGLTRSPKQMAKKNGCGSCGSRNVRFQGWDGWKEKVFRLQKNSDDAALENRLVELKKELDAYRKTQARSR